MIDKGDLDNLERLSTEKTTEDKANERKVAFDRLEELQHPKDYPDNFTWHLLGKYGYTEEEVRKMPPSKASDLAFRCVADDLLKVEFYDIDGGPTDFVERYYPGIDPDDFKVIPKDSSDIGGIFEKVLKRKEDSQVSNVSIKEAEEIKTRDPVEFFAQTYGKENIIALPFSIGLGTASLTISHQRDFIEPYGGNRLSNRVVYVQKEDPLFAGL